MFKRNPSTTPPPPLQPEPKKAKWTKWSIEIESNSTCMRVLLIDPKKVRNDDTILETDVITFAEVVHDDPQFEQKWSTALNKAKKRTQVLNQGREFVLGLGSICGNCGEPFEGEDYLCHECRQENPD